MKQTYKKIGIVAALGITLAAVSSCKKDYLKPQPLSFYEPSATYIDAAGLRADLVSCARNLRNEYFGDGMPMLTEELFSEVSVDGVTDKSGPAQDNNLVITPDNASSGNDNADHARIWYYWAEGYRGIKYANTVVSRINNATFASNDERNQILGAGYFHRAMRYYRLVHQFGDVPAVFKEINAPKLDFYSTQREVILKQIKLDLDSAVLWSSDAVNRGEVTKGACQHLLTKVNLALGNFDEAIAAANGIINGSVYALMKTPFGSTNKNVIWDLHRPENKSLGTNKEGIYMIIDRFGDGNYTGGSSLMRQCVPFWGSNVNTPSGVKGTNDGTAQPYIQSNFVGRGIGRCRQTAYSQWYIWDDANDLRHAPGNWYNMEDLVYNNYDALKASGSTPQDPYYLKNLQKFNSSGGRTTTDTIRCWFGWPQYKLFIPDNENSPMTGGHTDWYIFRIAETYLLRAEAYFWKGDLASAAADINAVRQRAGCAPITAAQVNMDLILNERARELFFEEPRKTELTRIAYIFAKTGKAAENGKTYTLANFSTSNYWYDRIMAKTDFYNKGVVTNHGDKYTMSPYHVLWPVPTAAIQANSYGVINQNTGYVGADANKPPLSTIPK
ncbi:MAG: RagB/SusD family nutrient uptake outer membrane protein [Chitinophagaceae bacterium]